MRAVIFNNTDEKCVMSLAVTLLIAKKKKLRNYFSNIGK